MGRRSNPGAKGITATVTKAGTIARIGARLKYNLFTEAGTNCSLRRNFIASANPCPNPKIRILVKGIPTRFGPRRSCIQALRRRSAVTLPGTITRTTPATAIAFNKDARTKTMSGPLKITSLIYLPSCHRQVQFLPVVPWTTKNRQTISRATQHLSDPLILWPSPPQPKAVRSRSQMKR